MEDKKKEGEIKVNGHAKFENGKLVPPTIKKKTVEELIAEIPDTPKQRKIDREINKIEKEYEENKEKKSKPKQKNVKAETLICKLEKIDGVSHYYNGYENVIKYKDRTICWIADRKNWVSVSTWGKGGSNHKTTRIGTQKEMYDILEELKDKIEGLK